MEKVYENMRKYGEKMKGKFSHNPHRNGIVISVTSPFVEEIHIDCDEDIYREHSYTYSLLEHQADHPEGRDWLIYYNNVSSEKDLCFQGLELLNFLKFSQVQRGFLL